MLVYNISADSWSTATARLSIPRTDGCMTAVAGKLYLAGVWLSFWVLLAQSCSRSSLHHRRGPMVLRILKHLAALIVVA